MANNSLTVTICRFTLSIIFYGILSISHWWVIALTTGGTVSFLVAKVLKYEVIIFD